MVFAIYAIQDTPWNCKPFSFLQAVRDSSGSQPQASTCPAFSEGHLSSSCQTSPSLFLASNHNPKAPSNLPTAQLWALITVRPPSPLLSAFPREKLLRWSQLSPPLTWDPDSEAIPPRGTREPPRLTRTAHRWDWSPSPWRPCLELRTSGLLTANPSRQSALPKEWDIYVGCSRDKMLQWKIAPCLKSEFKKKSSYCACCSDRRCKCVHLYYINGQVIKKHLNYIKKVKNMESTSLLLSIFHSTFQK